MAAPSSTSTAVRRPLRIGMPATAPLRQRMRHALVRWWLRQCLQAERATRFVPRY